MLRKLLNIARDILRKRKQKAKSQRCEKLARAAGTNPDLSHLLEKGWCNLGGVSNTSFCQYMKQKYPLSDDTFLPCEGNIAWPVMDDQIRDILCNTTFRECITDYFYCAYREIPILQMVPTITVTKPNITQEEYKHGFHAFPGAWHTDYPTEMGVHIPVNDITTQTTHTKYIETSNRVALEPDGLLLNDSFMEETYGPNCIVQCLAKAGEVLIMDTTGFHRAELNVEPRIVLQFKFTAGNDPILLKADNPSFKKTVGRVKENCGELEALKKMIKSDLDYIKRNTFGGMIKIISRSEEAFEAYLK